MADRDAMAGYPLREALERFADPATWRAFAEVADAEPPHGPSNWLEQGRGGGWLGEHRPTPRWDVGRFDPRRARWEQRKRALAALVADFRGRLISGELLATGWEPPLSLDTQRRDIPAKLWVKLRIDFGRSRARWCELQLREIRVRRAADLEHRPAAQGRGEATPETARLGRARPGRRSFMPEAEEEMRAMASCGALTGSLKADSHAIAQRVAARFPTVKVCEPKTIRNKLSKIYRILHQEQCARNNSGNY